MMLEDDEQDVDDPKAYAMGALNAWATVARQLGYTVEYFPATDRFTERYEAYLDVPIGDHVVHVELDQSNMKELSYSVRTDNFSSSSIHFAATRQREMHAELLRCLNSIPPESRGPDFTVHAIAAIREIKRAALATGGRGYG